MSSNQTPLEPDGSWLLLELSREVTAKLNLQEVLDTSLLALRRLLTFGGGAIQLIDDDALVAVATDPPATAEALTVRIPVGQGVSGRIVSTGEACYIPDIAVDSRVHPEGRAKGVSGGVHSYFGVPLILHGEPIGVVQFDSPEIDAFDRRARTLVLSFVPTIAAAVQNAQLFEREVANLNDLRELQRLRSDFLAVVSHELRTPLTSLSGMAQTLASHVDTLPADLVAQFAERIVSNGRRLEVLIDDLLDLSQLEQGRLEVAREPTDLRRLIEERVLDDDDESHPIEVQIAADLPLVLADDRRVRQILGNLIGNAAKFSDPGETITIKAFVVDDRVMLEIADNGIGVPTHLRDRIFEPFFQIEPAATRGVGGLGVGLHLVRELCQLMDATVEVESQPDRGTCFRVRFASALHPASV